jgi:hypothetical protein
MLQTGRFKCLIDNCYASYAYLKGLKRHWSNVHNGIGVYAAPSQPVTSQPTETVQAKVAPLAPEAKVVLPPPQDVKTTILHEIGRLSELQALQKSIKENQEITKAILSFLRTQDTRLVALGRSTAVIQHTVVARSNRRDKRKREARKKKKGKRVKISEDQNRFTAAMDRIKAAKSLLGLK